MPVGGDAGAGPPPGHPAGGLTAPPAAGGKSGRSAAQRGDDPQRSHPQGGGLRHGQLLARLRVDMAEEVPQLGHRRTEPWTRGPAGGPSSCHLSGDPLQARHPRPAAERLPGPSGRLGWGPRVTPFQSADSPQSPQIVRNSVSIGRRRPRVPNDKTAGLAPGPSIIAHGRASQADSGSTSPDGCSWPAAAAAS